MCINVFVQCSQTCGEGVKRRLVMCEDDENRPSGKCDANKRPANETSCNVDPCPRWNFGRWGKVRQQ